MKTKLISENYKRQLQEMHSNPKRFNNGSKKIGKVEDFLLKYSPSSLIDFGCSTGGLIRAISEKYPSTRVAGYDPGVKEFETLPNEKFDSLISTDALEHVEPDMLEETLKIVDNLFEKSAYLVIASYPAKKRLPDGRNAHLIIESFDWWREKLERNIQGRIVSFRDDEFYSEPKKGDPIRGREFLFIIEK